MKTTRPITFLRLSMQLLVVCLCVSLCAGRGFAQAQNLVIDGLQGDVTQNEVDTYISYINGGVGGALLPTNSIGDNLAYGTSGSTLEGLDDMYRITGDMPNMSVEHMQLLNLALVWSDRFILLRNDQPINLAIPNPMTAPERSPIEVIQWEEPRPGICRSRAASSTAIA